jgi:small subunit ribosomal protein S1
MSAEKRVGHPREVVKVGEVVRAQVLAVDREKRQIRLSMKSLAPTSIDEFLAEHKQGEVVTGRVLSVDGGEARVELGEGIQAECRIRAAAESAKVETQAKADLSSLTSMLNAKWKGGGSSRDKKPEGLSAGQIRSFRITGMDVEAKRIEVELT